MRGTGAGRVEGKTLVGPEGGDLPSGEGRAALEEAERAAERAAAGVEEEPASELEEPVEAEDEEPAPAAAVCVSLAGCLLLGLLITASLVGSAPPLAGALVTGLGIGLTGAVFARERGRPVAASGKQRLDLFSARAIRQHRGDHQRARCLAAHTPGKGGAMAIDLEHALRHGGTVLRTGIAPRPEELTDIAIGRHIRTGQSVEDVDNSLKPRFGAQCYDPPG